MPRAKVKFPEEILEQIDETALKLATEHGVVMKRSGVIRMLIERALTENYPWPLPPPPAIFDRTKI